MALGLGLHSGTGSKKAGKAKINPCASTAKEAHIACRRSERVKARKSKQDPKVIGEVSKEIAKKEPEKVSSLIADVKPAIYLKTPSKKGGDSQPGQRNAELSKSAFNLFKCTICPKLFTQVWMLRLHTTAHIRRQMNATEPIPRPSLSEKAFACCYCYMKFSDADKLRSHQQTHSANAYRCNKCPKRFDSKWKLQRHLMFPHEMNNGMSKPSFISEIP